MMSRVDVIVPCYKYGHFLRQCVDSVLAQDGVEVRVLIIDDASPDHTAEVGRELAAGDARVLFRRHDVNQGHIATYNEGLEWAAGDYLMLLSADDLLARGALARAAAVMDAHPEVGLACGKAIDFRVHPPIESSPVGRGRAARILTGAEFLENACRSGQNLVFTPTAVVRTSLQRRLGGYRKDLPHTGDMEMWMRCAVYGSVAITEEVQAFYRVHGENMHLRIAATTLRELKHRWAAFSALFQVYGDRVSEADSLLEMAGRSIAEEALGEAYGTRYDQDPAACAELVALATQAHPGVRSWPIYRTVGWKRRLGPRVWHGIRRLAFRRRIVSTRATPGGSLA
jgi:glycosyltransferase involved in cell wall biosynthesis